MIRPQFILQAFDSPAWLWLCVATALLAALLMVLLLRPERRLVPTAIGRLLLTLRLLTVAVLGLVLLEPVVTWSYGVEQTNRIVVALDVSDSMATHDDYARPAEKLRWARALGLIGNRATDARLDRWQAAFEAGNEPNWVEDGESGNAQQRAELAEVRRNNLEAVIAEVDALSRKEIAVRLLTQSADPLLASLGEIGEVDVQLFAGRSAPTESAAIVEDVENPSSQLFPDASNLAAPLSSPWSSDSAPPAGIVLLSDGRDHSGANPLEAAGRLASGGTRIFPVVLGSHRKPRDLAVAALDYPPELLQGDRGMLTATVNTSGFEGEEIEIVLEPGNSEPQSRRVTPTGPSTRVQFELAADTDQQRIQYTLRAAQQPDELRLDNNTQSFHVNVLDDTVDVLLIEGEARWEFRFIDNALSRDERITVSHVVFQQPYLGVLDKPFFPSTIAGFGDSSDAEWSPFANYDLVMIGDVPPSDLPLDFWNRMEDYVAKTGGTVIFIAGRRYLPAAFAEKSFERLLPLTDLRPMALPLPLPASTPGDNSFGLTLTIEGAGSPMLQFASSESANREVWSSLPGHYWGVTGKPKPGATVLAAAVSDGTETDTAEEDAAPIILRQPYGLGYVFWMGIDSTWRWRRRVGDEYHHRFWGQLCRWAVENKAVAGTEFVKFGPEQSLYQQGETVVVRARWTRSFLSRYPDFKASAHLALTQGEESASTSKTTRVLQPAAGRPSVYEARFDSLPPGEYRVQLEVEPAIETAEPIVALLRVGEVRSAELSDVSSNPELLERIANVSGGRLLHPDELDDLPPLLAGPSRREERQQELPLWTHWSMLTLFCVLLATEWTIRKLNGLP